MIDCYHGWNRKFLRLSLCYLVGVGPVLVLGPVGGVAEGLGAAGELAGVGLLSGVGPQVRLEILQAGVGLQAGLELEWREIWTCHRHSQNFGRDDARRHGRLARGSFN